MKFCPVCETRGRAAASRPSTTLAAAQKIRLQLACALLSGGGEVDRAALEVLTLFASWAEHGPDEMPLLKARQATLTMERDEYARRVAAMQGYLNNWDPEDWAGLDEMKAILDGNLTPWEDEK